MLLIVKVHFNLIVPRESIHERHPFKLTHIFYHDIRDWKGELIFRSRLILITKINANSDLPIFLDNGDDIGYPIRVLFFPDKIGVYKLLDFRLDRFHYLWAEPLLLLFDGLCFCIDVKVMHNHLRIKPRRIHIVPSENIYVFLYKRY